MLLPISWLKKYVDVLETPQNIAERFIALGFECELVNNDLIDLEVTPNRGDILSIVGLAREYAASTGQSVRMPNLANLSFSNSFENFSITADPAAYHRICATTITAITNQASPTWLREYLSLVGCNSVDLIVDLTNYVMFELGIPLHAFDLEKLQSQSFNVRLSSRNELFVSLKNEKVKLPENAIVVESGGEVIDLLGIRGGQSSMITEQTSRILVWAASVPRPLIRRAVKVTGIRTESAYRHERETDWDMVPVALARFVRLLTDIAGGEVHSCLDISATTHANKIVPYTREAINDLLGTAYSSFLIDESLQRLGFLVVDGKATVPSWRYFDIDTFEDLAEEVARLQGYANMPHAVIKPSAVLSGSLYGKAERLKDLLVAAGLVEVYSESFSGRQEAGAESWDEDNLAVLENPVNQEFAYCRLSMIPSMVKLLALNSWDDNAKVFEVGTVFPARDLEQIKVVLAGYGRLQPLFSQWLPPEAVRVIDVNEPIAKLYKLRRPITVAEGSLDSIIPSFSSDFSVPQKKNTYRKVSIYPPSVRDISVLVDIAVLPADLVSVIAKVAPERIIQVELFDQFTSDSFGANRQSLAFHLIYQSLDSTLAAEEVDELHQQVVAQIVERFDATIR